MGEGFLAKIVTLEMTRALILFSQCHGRLLKTFQIVVSVNRKVTVGEKKKKKKERKKNTKKNGLPKFASLLHAHHSDKHPQK